MNPTCEVLARYETPPDIQQTLRQVVSEYWKAHGGNPYEIST